MQTDRDKLRPLGVEPLTPAHGPIYAEVYRLARQLRSGSARAIGLVPADDRTEVLPLALQLGVVLREAASAEVAVLDMTPAPSPLATLDVDGSIEPGFATIALADGLHAVTPRFEREAGARDAAAYEDALSRCRERFGYVLADLTGLPERGAHPWAYGLVEGVAIIAGSGVTREGELSARHREVPLERSLGVLIVG